MLNLSWVLKNTEFSAYFKSFENVAKNSMRKKLSTKNLLCAFYYCVHKFSAYKFFGESFCIFSTDSNSIKNAFMILISNI